MNNMNDDATSAGVFYTLQLAFGGDPCSSNSVQCKYTTSYNLYCKTYFLVYLLSFWYEIEFSFAFFDIWEFGHNVNTQLNTYQMYGHLYTI